MTKYSKTKQSNFRFTEETLMQLDALCEVYKRNRTQLLEMLINTEYLRSTEVGMQTLKTIANDIQTLCTKLEGLKDIGK